jgi:hypothetical protein
LSVFRTIFLVSLFVHILKFCSDSKIVQICIFSYLFFYLKNSNFVLIQKMFGFKISTNSNIYSFNFKLVVKPLFNYII